MTPEKSKVAETLQEFRGQFAYNMLDENLRSMAARTAQINQWDDHEVRNNWFPGQVIPNSDTRYTEKRIDVLAARAKQALFEWLPITPRQLTDHDVALERLNALADELTHSHPGAAASLREGLAETLTLQRLGVHEQLWRSLSSTNPIESMISIVRSTSRNVKH